MIIERVMNNNAVIAVDEDGSEVVLLGKGIAFQKKRKQPVDPKKIEKKFVLQSPTQLSYLEKLIRSIPSSYLAVTNEIVEIAKQHIQADLKEDNLFISIVDHIAFAIERKKSGDYLENPLLIEIRKFYPNEFQVGLAALDIIKNHTGIQLDEDEAGYIAFHLVGASLKNQSSDAKKMVVVIDDLISIIERFYGQKLKTNSVYYMRFVTHLKYFLHRLFSNKDSKKGDDYLYKVAKKQYKKEHECVKKIADFLKDQHHCSVTNEELGYLMIHIKSMILHNQ